MAASLSLPGVCTQNVAGREVKATLMMCTGSVVCWGIIVLHLHMQVCHYLPESMQSTQIHA